ncbi:MAG TPA: NAD-dependent epimerase/dehydratase family protein [Pyrinomonadaceae bacterium]|nr:NAD-dependent epimerase/dehydratase family protein [Pyrinomonadaceae bacterium]
MEKLNVLVTGGAGFIGSHLVDALVDRGHSVRILDSLVPQVHLTGKPEFLNPAAEFIEGEVCNTAVVAKALEGIDAVFHEAAEVGIGQSMYEPGRFVSANDLGTAVLLESVLKLRTRIKKLVVASSMSIYGEGGYRCDTCGSAYPQLRDDDQLIERRWELRCTICEKEMAPSLTREDKPLFPTSVYAVTKQTQEQLCLVLGRAYGVPTVALRYFNVYGPRQALSNPYTGVCAIFSSRLLNDQPPLIFEDGGQTRDFVHVSDIVEANLLALETNSGNYVPINIGTGRPTSIRDVAGLLATGLNKNIQPQITCKYREGDTRHCVADISRAKALLGYQPRVMLEEGIKDLLSWVQQQTAKDQVAHATAQLEARQLVR